MLRRTRKNPLTTARDFAEGTLIADSVDTYIGGREFTWEDGGDGTGYPAIGGVAAGPARPWPSTTASGVVGWDSGVKKSTGGLVPIERFDPDTNGFAAALSDAIDEADADGGTVVLEAGKTYTAEAGVTTIDKHVRIDFNGAKVVRSDEMSNTPVLTLKYGNSAPQSVVAITNTTYNWGGSGTTTPSTRVELVSTEGWAAGDWAVIVSDTDLIPGGREGCLDGERLRVAGVSGNYVYFGRLLEASLTTSLRIARMTEKDCVLVDPWIEDEAGSPTSRNQEAISIYGAVKPRVTRPRMRNLLTTGLQFSGCVAGDVEGADVYNLRTSDTDAAYGYGILLLSCNNFVLSRMRGEYLRHLFTTGASGQGGSYPEDMWRFGANRGHRIIGGVSHDGGHTPFDVHEDAHGIVFDGCHVKGGHREPLGSLNGINLRGRKNTVQNCNTAGPTGVVVAASIEGGGGGHRIINHVHEIPEGYATEAFSFNYSWLSARASVELSGSVYAPNHSGTLISGNKATVLIPNLTLVFTTPQSPNRLIELTDTELIIDTLVVDFRGSTGQPRLFYLLDSLSSVKVNKLVVIAGGVTWRVAEFNNADGSVVVDRLECDTLPVSSDGGGISRGASSVYTIGEVVLNRVSTAAAVASRSDAAVTLNAFSEGVQVLNVALTASRTVTEPTLNLQVGRQILYVRTANATGTANWVIGGDSLPVPGMWLRRMWTGTAWITVGKGSLTGKPRVFSATSPSAPAIDTDRTDQFNITALANSISSFTTNLTGTPGDGQRLRIRIKGTATRSITWGDKFAGNLLTATSGTNTHLQELVYDAVAEKWIGTYADTVGY